MNSVIRWFLCILFSGLCSLLSINSFDIFLVFFFFFQGIIFEFLLETPEDLKKLCRDTNIARDLSYVMNAITLTRHTLNGQCPLFGFSGAPVSSA